MEEPKEQSLERSARTIAADFKKYIRWYKALVSVIGVCVMLLVLLDNKFQFIQKGDYIEPQSPAYMPLTPDYIYPGSFPARTDHSDSYTVYITAHGEKYRRVTCHYLTDSKRAIDLYDAIDGGYEPCSVCKP